MRPPPKAPPLEEVLAQLRTAFASHPPQTFGVHVKGKALFWRDSISGEIGAIATLPSANEPTVAAVLAELARLRTPCAKAGAAKKPAQSAKANTERRVEWHTAKERRQARTQR